LNLVEDRIIYDFAKTIAGFYSNKKQALDNPRLFAHINFCFKPIPWSILKAPGFYSEQSYDYDPWSPYRQNVHKVLLSKGNIIVENYKLINRERVAGAILQSKLLNAINNKSIVLNQGCSMHFKRMESGHYLGNVEPGKKCIICRFGRKTYLVSSVEVNNKNWVSFEQGLDTKTNQQIWGAENGEFYFDKINSLEKEIDKRWLIGNNND